MGPSSGKDCKSFSNNCYKFVPKETLKMMISVYIDITLELLTLNFSGLLFELNSNHPLQNSCSYLILNNFTKFSQSFPRLPRLLRKSKDWDIQDGKCSWLIVDAKSHMGSDKHPQGKYIRLSLKGLTTFQSLYQVHQVGRCAQVWLYAIKSPIYYHKMEMANQGTVKVDFRAARFHWLAYIFYY
jgi:hypothetical protein